MSRTPPSILASPRLREQRAAAKGQARPHCTAGVCGVVCHVRLLLVRTGPPSRFLHPPSVERANRLLKRLLQLLSPHYCLGRSIYQVWWLRGLAAPWLQAFAPHPLSGLSWLCLNGLWCHQGERDCQCPSNSCFTEDKVAAVPSPQHPQVSQCYKGDQGKPNDSPFTYATTGTFLLSMLIQAVGERLEHSPSWA